LWGLRSTEQETGSSVLTQRGICPGPWAILEVSIGAVCRAGLDDRDRVIGVGSSPVNRQGPAARIVMPASRVSNRDGHAAFRPWADP
jgi:hypothetical protein